MGSARHLLTGAALGAAIALVFATSAPLLAAAGTGLCSGGGSIVGSCQGVLNGRVVGPAVELGGDLSRPGSSGTSGRSDAPRASNGPWGIGLGLVGGRRSGDSCSPEAGCGDVVRPGVAPVGDSFETSVPGVTIADVASFAPVAPRDAMEPGPGVAVRRLPANFISAATTQVVDGVVLDRPAAVRFTPVGFSWATGDGGRVEASTSGASWARLGVRELTDTATSHRYAERGRYDVQPVVTYAAEYRFDASGWVPIEGTLDVTGETFPVRVVTVETRLVRGDCLQYPHDPGCE